MLYRSAHIAFRQASQETKTLASPRWNQGRALGNNVVFPPSDDRLLRLCSGTARSGGRDHGGALPGNVVLPPRLSGVPQCKWEDRDWKVAEPIPRRIECHSSSAAVIGLRDRFGSRGRKLWWLAGSGHVARRNVVRRLPFHRLRTRPPASGRKGIRPGVPAASGSVLAPPKAEGGSKHLVLARAFAANRQQVELPALAGKGSLAMSPSGGGQTRGLGGAGGGTSTGPTATGPGSGMKERAQAPANGSSLGSDANARGGEFTTGTGGAGTRHRLSCCPGVDVPRRLAPTS